MGFFFGLAVCDSDDVDARYVSGILLKGVLGTEPGQNVARESSVRKVPYEIQQLRCISALLSSSHKGNHRRKIVGTMVGAAVGYSVDNAMDLTDGVSVCNNVNASVGDAVRAVLCKFVRFRVGVIVDEHVGI